MDPDDEICYCYHVSMRKLVNYARRTRPERPSQMTGCLNAGTGCGWCIPFLKKIANDPDAIRFDDLTPSTYADQRQEYIKTKPKNKFGDAGGEVAED
ncbi:MAG: (2Fe-2S)-binding protein [Phycisphaerae bacterium]|jgi:NAD(P)H-nitrite reductase large subunit